MSRIYLFSALSGMCLMTAACGETSPEQKGVVSDPLAALGESIAQMHVANDAIVLPLTDAPLSIEAAWEVQAHMVEALEADWGPVVGWKVAYASASSQERWGMSEPAAGPVFSSQMLADGMRLDVSDFHLCHIETELALVLAEDVLEPVEDARQLMERVRAVHVAFDIPDVRFSGDPSATPSDVIATGACARRFVLGPAADPMLLDLNQQILTLERHGEQVYGGPAHATMGSPWESLRWLANKQIERGQPLRAGQIVFLGSVDVAYTGQSEGRPISGSYVGHAGALPPVEVTLVTED